MLGELESGRAGSSRGSVDEHALPGSELGTIDQAEPREMERKVERGGVRYGLAFAAQEGERLG